MRRFRLHMIVMCSLVVGLIGFPLVAFLIASRTTPVVDAITGALHISGNHFTDDTGSTVTLRGASRISLEWSCSWDDHSTLADFQQMRAWGMNAVRIALNSSYWLYGDKAGCTAATYQGLAANAVHNAEDAGLYVILVGQWSELATNSEMAYPQDLPFWQQVATTYATDTHVGFVPVTEPHGVTYDEWYNGWQGGPGMHQLVATITAAAPNHVIFVNGIQWADDLSFLTSPYAITGPNIAYELHIYQNWNPKVDVDPYMSRYAVVAGEFGTNDWNGARNDYNLAVMNYFEQHHTGYFAWAWNVHGTCDPNPWIFETTWGNVSWFGQLVHDFIANALNPTRTSSSSLALPLAWTCVDVGNPTPTGSEAVSAETWAASGGGNDIWGKADTFHYDYERLAGNGTIAAHVTDQTDTSQYAKAGVMFRQSLQPDAAFYGIFVTPANGILVQYRAAAGASAQQAAAMTGTVPISIQVARTGQLYAAYTSVDGQTWTLVPGSTVRLDMAGGVLAGLAVTSHNADRLSTVNFDAVTLGTNPPPLPVLPIFACPNFGSCQNTSKGDSNA